MQKHRTGDLVRVAKDLGPAMSHFESDCDAIVIDRGVGGYIIFIKDKGKTAGYEGHQLTLIEENRVDLLKQWEVEIEKKADLDWIFTHTEEVLKNTHGATIVAINNCLLVGNLWGNNGEGVNYYANAAAIMKMARPYLETGDKDGWLNYCKAANE